MESITIPFDDLLPKLPEEVALAARECWEACKDSKAGDWMSHIHHEFWLERLMEPVENRIWFILLHKDPAEHVERLRRLRPFDTKKATPEYREALTAYTEAWRTYDKATYYKAGTAYNKAGTAYNKAGTAYNKAGTAYDKAWSALQEVKFSPEMMAVHAEVCDCPWSETKDIFGNSF